MRRVTRALAALLPSRPERGQMMIVVALLVIPLSLALAVAATDVALWQSERRGAQKDADLAALAGAYELLPFVQDADAARAAAVEYADVNDEADNALVVGTPVVDNSCFSSEGPDGQTILDSVWVTVEHESRTLFAEAFGIPVPQIGAKARACMGSPIEGRGLLPIGVQVTGPNTDCFDDHDGNPNTAEVPVFGQFCQLGFAGADLASGEGGFLKLFNDGDVTCSHANTGGGQTLTDEIAAGGANTTCYVAPAGATCDAVPADWPYGDEVNYCVWPKTQTFNNPTQDSFWCMIRGDDEVPGNSCANPTGEGECDDLFGTDANDNDDWLEVVEAVNGDPDPDPGTTTFARRDCTSPRLVDLVIIEQFDPNGNEPRKIVAFASFYIQSCIVDGVEFRNCDVTGGNIGQAGLYGFFMNILENGAIGASNDYGQRAITLWE
jgi:hypothetical protein